ncbi:Xaa-Pro peptidase family protein [Alphaproteobacteria bacterium]|nr:Xaa-Pro peptidase family protein [Alphaproteobacteria bacterium]
MKNRLDKINIIFDNSNLEMVAIVPGANFRYLTNGNFHLMERPTVLLLKKNTKPIVILPLLEVDVFKNLNFDAEIISWQDKDGYINAFYKASQLLGKLNSIGVEGQRIRFFESSALQEVFPDSKIVNSHALISKIRLNKDSNEIDSLKKAISISEKSLSTTLDFIKENKTELEIKNFLIQELYKNGSEGLSFDPIVLASKNSALPHGHSTNYNLKKGDAILFDFGGTINGYNADITRTFFLDHADDYQIDVYKSVLEANLIGIEKSKVNTTLHEVDNSVLNFLEKSQHSQYIVHKTGHGLGLDVHEDPYVVRGNQEKLEEGMVITIEPGLYNPDALGVRIEDNVHITANGPEILTSFNKKLTIV